MKYHRFRLVSSFTAQHLFLTLKKTVEHKSWRNHKPNFDFDWLKRKIFISANSKEGVEEILTAFDRSLKKEVGEENIVIPGKVEETDEGRFQVPIGVMLQAPEDHAGMMAALVREMGIVSVKATSDGEILIPLNFAVKALPYREFLTQYPLPGYLTLQDEGVS